MADHVNWLKICDLSAKAEYYQNLLEDASQVKSNEKCSGICN